MVRYFTRLFSTALLSLIATTAAAQMTVDWQEDSQPQPLHSTHWDDIADEASLSQPLTSFYKGGAADSDADGLSDTEELALGTDPNDIDSDCDSIGDGTETGDPATPNDSDMDGIIDALENQFADSDGDMINDQDDPSSGWQLSCGKFSPFAIANDGNDSTRIEVRIEGGTNVSAVTVKHDFFINAIQLDGVAVAAGGIALFDDGSNGDRRANDNIWTRDGITATSNTSSATDQGFNRVEVTDNSGTSDKNLDTVIGGSFDQFLLGIVAANTVITPQAVGSNSQQVSHLVNVISAPGMLAVKQFLNSSINNDLSLRIASQAFYNDFNDDYDFLMLFPESPSQRGSFGVATNASNNVSGIGTSIFDNTASWGSSGKLQAVVTRNMGNNGPTLHEFMHRWGVYLDASLGFSQCVGGHWGFAGVGEGQLGGFDPATLVDNNDGTFTVNSFGAFANGGDSVNYAMIELYLAGLADASEVPDMIVPVNASCNSLSCNNGSCTFAADSVKTVTINDIINIEGARNPSFNNSQKAFTAAFVVFSQYTLDSAEMAYYNNQSILFGSASGDGFLKSFQQATLGRATMDTMIKTPVIDEIFVDQFE